MRKNERKEIGLYRTQKREKHNVKEQIHVQLYGNWVMEKEKMKKTIVKEFSDWTIEDMVEYVLTGRKPVNK